jgi:hypothetical protein
MITRCPETVNMLSRCRHVLCADRSLALLENVGLLIREWWFESGGEGSGS